MEITWSIEGERQLSRRLRGLSLDMADWTQAFSEAGSDLRNTFQTDVFNTKGRAIQTRWSPLTRAYARRKAEKYPGKGLLEATGAMRRSFKTKFDANSATVWNTAEYFKYHQSNQPRSRLPRRVMMRLGHAQREMVVKIFHNEIAKKLAKRV